MAIDGLSNALVCPLFLRALLLFPHGVPPESRWIRYGLWGTAAYGVLYTSALYGVPSGLPHAFPALFAANALLYAVAPAALTRSYRRADSIGRRQIRWVVFGAYCASAPVILGALLVLRDPGALFLWLMSIAAMALFPLSILIAIARYNLFDIDRLISAATSYTIVLAVLVAAGLIVVPRAAEVVAEVFNVDPTVAQAVLAVLLAGLVVPGRRGLGPVVDRGLFPERFALAHGVDRLVAELSECGEPEDLALKTGEELDRLIRPATCVLYTRRGDRYSPVFVRGVTVPPDLEAAGPLIRALESEKRPVEVDAWFERGPGSCLTAEEIAAVESMRATVLVPVLRRHAVAALICLGTKRSGDVYTATDLALLGVVASKVATELLRFDDATLASIGERMAGMMHDLRNPLSIALGFTEMLASAETPEQRAELTQTIQRQFSLMERMARDVLAFARGESPLLIGKVRVEAFLRDLRAQIEPELEKHGVRLVLAPDFDGVAWFDEAKLLRAIYSLVRNAIEAMPGGGTVRVATRRVGERLVFELCDTGTGIPPEIAHRLFSRFATAGKKGGTGLGLATVKKIVEEHGGTIAVQSTPGTGTCFRLELPLEPGGRVDASA